MPAKPKALVTYFSSAHFHGHAGKFSTVVAKKPSGIVFKEAEGTC